QKLLSYPFPGNVRELKSVMELSVVLSDGETVSPEHISVNASATLSNLMSHEKSLKEYETQIIQHFLDKYDKDVLLVAKKLDV
ncbi:hypothetical protein AB9E30_38860, partial [Rhizobium leguminosarum]